MNLLPPILLVDDDASDQELLSLVLRGGFGEVEIAVAADSAALIRALTGTKYGLVLAEIELPWIDGAELVRLVREMRPGCPVVIVTGRAPEDVAEKVLRVGADGFVTKTSQGLAGLPSVIRTALFHARRQSFAASRDAPFRRLFEGLPVGVFVASGDGTILETNPAMAAMLGFRGPEELVRRPLHWLLADGSAIDAWETRLRSAGGVARLDARLNRADGRTVWARLSAWFVEETDSGLRQIHGVVEETSEHRAAQEEIARQSKALDQANEELEQMAYVVSHDLQGPLGQVRRFLDLLSDENGAALSDEGRSFMEGARRGAFNLERMVDGVLGYARIETEAAARTAVDLNAVVARILEMCGDLIEKSHAEIIVEALPTVVANEAHMEQLFQNLVSNALKFSAPAAGSDGEPQVHVGAEEESGLWHLWVRDNGIGFDPTHADRIFTMFQRLHSETEYPGTGIGLAICRRIVIRHGGRLWAESRPGKGATFHVTLPKPSSSAHDGSAKG